MSNKEYDNTNSGALFINHDKKAKAGETDTSGWGDYNGSINIAGVECWLTGWKKKIKKGKRQGEVMLSLAVKPKNDQDAAKLKSFVGSDEPMKTIGSDTDLSGIDDMDDDLPF